MKREHRDLLGWGTITGPNPVTVSPRRALSVIRRAYASALAAGEADPTDDEVVLALEAMLMMSELSGNVSDEDRDKWRGEAIFFTLVCMVRPEPLMELRNLARIMLNFVHPGVEDVAPPEVLGAIIGRNHPAVAVWRAAVLKRDGHQCRFCYARKDLHAHHVKRWIDAPSQRLVVDNGLTLCAPCHHEVHSGSQH